MNKTRRDVGKAGGALWRTVPTWRWLAAPILAFGAQTAMALGLGDATVRSYLGQPLVAHIKLLSRSAEELEGMTAGLASAERSRMIGIDRMSLSVPLDFTLNKGEAGPYIEVRSRTPVNDPVVQFVVEVQFANGRLMRQYTLFLDPPSFAAPVPLPSLTRPGSTTPERPRPEPAVEPAAAPKSTDRIVDNPAPRVAAEDVEPAPLEWQDEAVQSVAGAEARGADAKAARSAPEPARRPTVPAEPQATGEETADEVAQSREWGAVEGERGREQPLALQAAEGDEDQRTDQAGVDATPSESPRDPLAEAPALESTEQEPAPSEPAPAAVEPEAGDAGTVDSLAAELRAADAPASESPAAPTAQEPALEVAEPEPAPSEPATAGTEPEAGDAGTADSLAAELRAADAPAPESPPAPPAEEPALAAGEPEPAPSEPEPAAVEPEAEVADSQAPDQPATVSSPQETPPAPGLPRYRAGAGDLERYGPVQRGDTLWGIASSWSRGSGYSVNQAMLAIQRYNPGAFGQGNINLLKAGAILWLPPMDDLAALSQREAMLEAMRQADDLAAIRAGRLPAQRTPVLATGGATDAEPAGPADQGPDGPRGRLELVPPRPSADAVGHGSGEGGEGSGLSDNAGSSAGALSEEELASAEAESEYLSERIREMEAELAVDDAAVALKDPGLAELEQRLEAKRAAGEAEPQTVAAPPDREPAPTALGAWLLAALAGALGALVWWFRRRSRADRVGDLADTSGTVRSLTGEAEEILRVLDSEAGTGDGAGVDEATSDGKTEEKKEPDG